MTLGPAPVKVVVVRALDVPAVAVAAVVREGPGGLHDEREDAAAEREHEREGAGVGEDEHVPWYDIAIASSQPQGGGR